MPDSSPRRRGRHDIVMEVLKSAINGAKKTTIMYKANLSFTQLENYLNALKEADFLTEESGIWKTTEKGLHVIEACKICSRLMKKAW
jgi:predicted transcriptional regulator